jgi:SAM-dependent methyltransferase
MIATEPEGYRATVLDVGCGIAGLYNEYRSHERWKKLQLDYWGIDGASAGIGLARQKFPELHERLFVSDILDPFVPLQVDITILCGPLADCLNFKHVRQVLEASFERSKQMMIVSAVSTLQPFRTDSGLIMSPADFASIMSTLSGRYSLDVGYIPQEILAVVYKDSFYTK